MTSVSAITKLTPEGKRDWVLAGTTGLERSRRLMEVLRAPGGCPWDCKQTHHSLGKYLLEESHELLELLSDPWSSDRDADLQEELGDVLLQVLFHARIAEQENRFDIDAVADGLVSKMIARHPHVFAEDRVDSAEQVKERWEQRKLRDKGPQSFGSSVPRSLAGLQRSQLINDRASQMGFDWATIDDVFAKLKEEEQELREAIDSGNKKDIQHEIGDLLTVVVNLARFAGVDAEESLQSGTDRFSTRFRSVLAQVGDEPVSRAADPALWDRAWERAKLQERSQG